MDFDNEYLVNIENFLLKVGQQSASLRNDLEIDEIYERRAKEARDEKGREREEREREKFRMRIHT